MVNKFEMKQVQRDALPRHLEETWNFTVKLGISDCERRRCRMPRGTRRGKVDFAIGIVPGWRVGSKQLLRLRKTLGGNTARSCRRDERLYIKK